MDQTLPIDDTQTRDPDDARWRQVAERRPGGDFVYAVTTTGIYCKPGCASRLPKRQNVAFFDDGAGAEAAGFRPCKRCRPDNARIVDPRLAAVAEACRLIETAESPPALDALAAATEKAATLWTMLDKHLADKPFITGDELNMGDIPLGCSAYRWHTLVPDGPDLPNLRAWWDRLNVRPAYQKNVMLPFE